VPAWLPEKVVALLRTLPKELRRPLVPLPDAAAAVLDDLDRRRGRQSLLSALCDVLASARGVQLEPSAFDERALAPHLSMRVAVLEADGTQRAAGRDLRALQRDGLVAAAEPARSPRAREQWSKSGLTQWDFGDLPAAVVVPQKPRDITLWPALQDVAGRVDLSLAPPGPPAIAQHRSGVRRLLLKCLPQQAALVRDSLLAERDLVLAYHGIGNTDALVDDLLCASAEQCFMLDPLIRERAVFTQRLAEGRAEFVATADRLRALLHAILPLYRQLRRELDAASGKGAQPAIRDDIAAQVSALIAPYFLTNTPPDWRKHLPRYLRAAQQRWQKRGQRQDAELIAPVHAAAARLERWRAALPEGWPWPASIVEYRWMLEELRVSAFAQSLGTALPVSAKRLEQAWQRALAAEARVGS
jgi:ATP-dependent helicase HrpA